MSTAVDARTGEEKRERRTLLPKFLPTQTERTSTSYDPWPSRERLLPSRRALHLEEAERTFAQNSEIYLPIQEKKEEKENKRSKYTDYLCYCISLIALVDVQNLSLFTIQGVAQAVDLLVGKYQFRNYASPGRLKEGTGSKDIGQRFRPPQPRNFSELGINFKLVCARFGGRWLWLVLLRALES